MKWGSRSFSPATQRLCKDCTLVIINMKPILLPLILNSQRAISKYKIFIHRICNAGRCQTLPLAVIFSQLPFSCCSSLQNHYHIHKKIWLINCNLHSPKGKISQKQAIQNIHQQPGRKNTSYKLMKIFYVCQQYNPNEYNLHSNHNRKLINNIPTKEVIWRSAREG